MKVTIDIKACSDVDYRKTGFAAYAQHPSTRIVCIALKEEDKDAVLWINPVFQSKATTALSQKELFLSLNKADQIEGYEILLEYFLWKYQLCPHYGLSVPDEKKFHCLKARAGCWGLPQNFPLLCQIIGIEFAGRSSEVSPEELCKQSVAVVCAEAAVAKRLPAMSEREDAFWQLGLKINSRGYQINALQIQKNLEQLKVISERLQNHLQISRQHRPEGMKRKTRGDFSNGNSAGTLFPSEDPCVYRTWEIQRRRILSFAAKQERMLEIQCSDHRIRGTFFCFGHSAGAWKERLIRLNDSEIGEGTTSQNSRYFTNVIVPGAQHEFIVIEYPDLSGRILAWLSEDEHALIAYRQNRDLFAMTGAAIQSNVCAVNPEKEKILGRIAELAFRYQGGVERFRRFAKNENIDLPEETIEQFFRQWCNTRPRVVQFWHDVEQKCYDAYHFSKKVPYRKIQIECDRSFLNLHLPTESTLRYFMPEKDFSAMVRTRRQLISVWIMKARYWCRKTLYGGMLTREIVSAIACGFLGNRMLVAENADYPVVRILQNGFLIENPRSHGSLEKLLEELDKTPMWTEQLPIKVTGRKGGSFE